MLVIVVVRSETHDMLTGCVGGLPQLFDRPNDPLPRVFVLAVSV